MRTPSALVSLAMTLAATSACYAGFTGFTTERVVTVAGNTQYSVFANFDSVGLPSGKSWVFLNAYNYQQVSGAMSARHQDAAEDFDGNPSSSWNPSANLLGSVARENDSWVTASGLGTSSSGTSFYCFNETVFDELVSVGNQGVWYDGTPGTQNLVAAGGASGFRMKLIQFVRTGIDNYDPYSATFQITYKVQDTATPLTGTGSFAVPAPGAVALAGLAGLMGRRRR
jgi:hypothetical protein